jgi:hypothetical protein
MAKKQKQNESRGTRVEQSPGIFYLTRCSQLVSGMIVGPIQAYFVYHLVKEELGLPYVFFVVGDLIKLKMTRELIRL